MSIKAIVFDCGNVLLRNGDLTSYAAWEARLGLQAGELAQRMWAGEEWALAEVGKITDAEFWRRVGAWFGLKEDEQVAALREEFWQTWIVDEKVLALVERARAKYQVAILRNSTDALEDLLEHRYHVADRFGMILNSARLGLAKPNKAIYEEALKRLKASAQEVVFIDDRAENIAAAATLGMHVNWFVHPDELERQLEVYLNHRAGNNGGAPTDEGVSSQQ